MANTIARGIEFDYRGSPLEGTVITFGDNRTCEVTAAEYAALRAWFRPGTQVEVGASRDNPPQGSLGHWLHANIREQRAIASYVAPILIDIGWAEQVNRTTIRFV